MLSSLKVIELASVLAGPDVGMFFAELGAKVIKIENKLTDGDITRKWKNKSENKLSKASSYFSSVNWNKKHIFLNLKESSDKEKVYQLVEESDIIICNFKPGDEKKLGMDYSTIKSFNKSIIYGEINGYGSSSNKTAYDVVLQAETGFMSMNGTKDCNPIKIPLAIIDLFAAHQLKEGILVALLEKEKTGKGAFVEVSLYDSALASLKNQATNWLMSQVIAEPMGSLHPNIAPYGETFKTKDDKYIVLAIGSNKHFNLLAEVINMKHLKNNEKYNTNQSRVKNRENLYKELEPYFSKKTRSEIIGIFMNHNIPAGSVNNMKEVFEDERSKGLILQEEIDGEITKRVKTSIFKIRH